MPVYLQVLYVNMVTACTMGMSLAVEPAEPGVMNKPPRRVGKRLLGKLVLWRCFFVCLLLVILVLSMYHWALETLPKSYSEDERLNKARAEAFNVLVFGEIGYCLTTRFIKMSTFHPRVFVGNYVIFLTMALTAGLQVFLTYTPGVQWFFNMDDGMDGIQWARVIVCMFVVYIVVEIEKQLVDPIMMPIVRPCFNFLSKFTPKYFQYNPSEDEHDKVAKERRSSHMGGGSEPHANASTERMSATYGIAIGRVSAVRTGSGKLLDSATAGKRTPTGAAAAGNGASAELADVKLTLEDEAKAKRMTGDGKIKAEL